MPLGQEFWVIVTGICFVLAGLAILTGIQDVLAARLLALMFLTFNLLALPQFIFADPRNHAAWGGNAFNLALVAANWILADSISLGRGEPQHQKSKPNRTPFANWTAARRISARLFQVTRRGSLLLTPTHHRSRSFGS
jgi:hypothetical protein